MYYESSKYIDDAINYFEKQKKDFNRPIIKIETDLISCLLYTSDAADE